MELKLINKQLMKAGFEKKKAKKDTCNLLCPFSLSAGKTR